VFFLGLMSVYCCGATVCDAGEQFCSKDLLQCYTVETLEMSDATLCNPAGIHHHVMDDAEGQIIVAIVVVLLLMMAFLTLYYRRMNEKLRQYERHSDLTVSMLSMDHLSEMEHREISKKDASVRSLTPKQSAVEMISHMWTEPTGCILQPWQINFGKVQLGKRIGSGAASTVFEGLYDDAQQPVAIKRMLLSIDEETRRTEIKSAQVEMQILWELRHPVRTLLHNFLHYYFSLVSSPRLTSTPYIPYTPCTPCTSYTFFASATAHPPLLWRRFCTGTPRGVHVFGDGTVHQ
jgi:hypothetical protein